MVQYWDMSLVLSCTSWSSSVGHVVSRVQDSPALNQQDVVVVQEIEDIDVTASHDGHTLPVWSTWTDQDVDILDEVNVMDCHGDSIHDVIRH